jgi:hypothetical protein
MSLLGSFLKSALRAEPLKTSRFLTNSISHRFICASRLSKEHFWKSSALGISLTNLGDAQHCEFSIAYEFNGNICSYYNDFFSAEYRDQIEDLADQAEEYVRDNPFRAVGITFAAGLVLGLLLRRR